MKFSSESTEKVTLNQRGTKKYGWIITCIVAIFQFVVVNILWHRTSLLRFHIPYLSISLGIGVILIASALAYRFIICRIRDKGKK